jgi:hypothetical protein
MTGAMIYDWNHDVRPELGRAIVVGRYDRTQDV